MSADNLVDQIMTQVMTKVSECLPENAIQNNRPSNRHPRPATNCGLTEFVGTATGDTIGLIIANVDDAVLSAMKLDKPYRSLGLLGGQRGAGPQIMAADWAVKATNTEIVSIDLTRDAKSGAGLGSLIIFGGDDVSDVRRAVEVALAEVDRAFGDVYRNEAGHIELQYTARAGSALEKAFGVEVGAACGVIIGSPAAIGIVMADTAVKAANVNVVAYCPPAHATCYANELTFIVSGDSGSVRQAVISARDVGKKLLAAMGSEPQSSCSSYI